MLRSIGERGEIIKGLMRAVGIVFDEPAGQVKIAGVDVIEADVRQGQPFILKCPVKAFEAGIIFGLMGAGIELLDAKLLTGVFKLPGELTAVVGVDAWQVSLGQKEQALQEIDRLSGRAAQVDTGKGQPRTVFEGGEDVAALTVPPQLDGIGMPQQRLGQVMHLVDACFGPLVLPFGSFGDPLRVGVQVKVTDDPLDLPGRNWFMVGLLVQYLELGLAIFRVALAQRPDPFLLDRGDLPGAAFLRGTGVVFQ